MGTFEDPWFVAKDIAMVLGYRIANDMTRMLQDEEKGTHLVRTLGGKQTLITINESGLYHCIFNSKRQEAEKFRLWVTSDVLPSLRKRGYYKLQGEMKMQLNMMNDRLKMLENNNVDLKNRLEEKTEEYKELYIDFKQLEKNHNKILLKRSYHTFKQGACFYLVVNPNEPEDMGKYGISMDINSRLCEYRTRTPDTKIVFLVYLNEAETFEKMFSSKYKNYKVRLNHEVIKGVCMDQAVDWCLKQLQDVFPDHTVEDEIDLYNNSV